MKINEKYVVFTTPKNEMKQFETFFNLIGICFFIFFFKG